MVVGRGRMWTKKVSGVNLDYSLIVANCFVCGLRRSQISWGQGSVCTLLRGSSFTVLLTENPALAVLSTSPIADRAIKWPACRI